MMRRILLLNIVLIGFANLFSQDGDYFLSIKKYPFINYSKNNLIFPSDSNALEPLYQKLDSIMLFGSGKLNIVHIGGSHIQADIYTHHIRKRLQTLQYDMNGGRGLIFPFTMAKTNNPWNYRVRYTGKWDFCKNTQYKRSCALGLTGISVTTTSQNATIKILPNIDSTINYTFTKVKLFHSETRYSIAALVNDSIYIGKYDSLGGYSAFNTPISREIVFQFSNNDTLSDNLSVYGISLENDDPGIVYNAIGVNGAKLESYLYCEMYQKQLQAVNPDLVIFSIGTNDGNTKYFNSEKYHDEYEALINKTKLASPNAIILITVPNDAYYYKRYVNKNTLLLRKEIYTIAKENNYGIWDFFEIMGGLNSSQKWYNYDIMRYDRVHFNRKGYLLKGDLFVTALLRGWEKNLAFRYSSYFNEYQLTTLYPTSQYFSE